MDDREPDRTPEEEVHGSRARRMSAEPKTYAGHRRPNGGADVVVKERGAPAYPLRHEVRHSPTGFEFGYAGSGPSDLARCILLDWLADREDVERLYQQFKLDVIAGLSGEAFELSSAAIDAWIKDQP